jgi:hypothetical protein
VFATCISCRERSWSKRKAVQPPSYPRQHSKHTSIDYCSRCQHTVPPSASTSISIDLGNNTLKTCSSCRYRSRRDSVLPSAVLSLPESSTLADVPPQPLVPTIPLQVLRPLLPWPVTGPTAPRLVSIPALSRSILLLPVSPQPDLPPPSASRPLLPQSNSPSMLRLPLRWE